MAGDNLCAVRSRSGEWEALQFESAEEIEPMVFRLRNLVRAQGGTDDAMAAGAEAGAPFVFLDGATKTLGLKASEIGTPMEWRIAAIGRPLDDPSVLVQTATLGQRAVKPLSPVHLRCVFRTDGAIQLGWTRRTRIAGDRWDGLDAPLGEEIERYRIAIRDPAGQELALESAIPSIAVSSGELIAAFNELPSRLEVRVAQYSLRYGVGTERSAVFERPPIVN